MTTHRGASGQIPERMQAVQLTAQHEAVADAIDGLRVVELPVPQPASGQVLVRIEAAPCNPSDLLFLQGKYGVRKALPTVPGWEGAGTVVAAGAGWLPWWLNGKRVACGVQADRDGTWAEYCVADATDCMPLKSGVSWEAGASLIVNPLTAVGLLETAQRGNHRAAVHTGAASQLGRMLLRLAQDASFPLICVVRRAEQVDLLKSLGAEMVLNSSDEDFVDQLTATCREYKATIAFDAVAGDSTGTLLNALPTGGRVYVYGALSEQACAGIDPVQLIFRNKCIHGFYLGAWIRSRGIWGVIRASNRVQRLLQDGSIETHVQRRVSLSNVRDGLHHYVGHMTDGKILIVPPTA